VDLVEAKAALIHHRAGKKKKKSSRLPLNWAPKTSRHDNRLQVSLRVSPGSQCQQCKQASNGRAQFQTPWLNITYQSVSQPVPEPRANPRQPAVQPCARLRLSRSDFSQPSTDEKTSLSQTPNPEIPRPPPCHASIHNPSTTFHSPRPTSHNLLRHMHPSASTLAGKPRARRTSPPRSQPAATRPPLTGPPVSRPLQRA
jgi:hypothetical protein